MTWTVGSSLLPTVDPVTGRKRILYGLLLFRSNYLSHFFGYVINNITLWPCVLPEAHWFICEGYHVLFTYGINKALDVYAYKFCTLCFSFLLLLCLYSYALTHSRIDYRSMSTLDPIDNSSAIAGYDFENTINRPRTKVRKVVRYHENLPDYYNTKKGLYSLVKSQLRQ